MTQSEARTLKLKMKVTGSKRREIVEFLEIGLKIVPKVLKGTKFISNVFSEKKIQISENLE